MIIIEKQQSRFTPNLQVCFVAVFGLGVISAFALVIAALVAVAYLLNLAMGVLVECCTHIAALYAGSDSAIKLFILFLIGYCLVKLVRSASRSLRKYK